MFFVFGRNCQHGMRVARLLRFANDIRFYLYFMWSLLKLWYASCTITAFSYIKDKKGTYSLYEHIPCFIALRGPSKLDPHILDW